ncbi:hypothetical protein LguiB_013954 [Lonicera macranthoides]
MAFFSSSPTPLRFYSPPRIHSYKVSSTLVATNSNSKVSPIVLGLGFHLPNFSKRSVLAFAASHEESKPSEIEVEDEKNDIELGAKEFEESKIYLFGAHIDGVDQGSNGNCGQFESDSEKEDFLVELARRRQPTNNAQFNKKSMYMKFCMNTAEPSSSYFDIGKGILSPAPPAPSKEATLPTTLTT